MVKTVSNMLPLGTIAPEFSLHNVMEDTVYSLKQQSHDYVATVIMFLCNHCPYVKHVNKELTRLALDYLPKKIRFIAINSNDIEQYPEDSPANMQQTALRENYPFPYLYDATQDIAHAYQAACTPDFYVFDKELKLV